MGSKAKKISGVLFGAGILFLIFIGAPSRVFAASLFFSPSMQTVSVGQTFTVAVEVSSIDQAMNAVSGDVAFPSDELRVLSVSQSDSIINLWINNPSFTNAVGGGEINFEGALLNPGFSGADGKVVQILFKAIAPGNVPLSFLRGAVLANNGKGTNILTEVQAGSVIVMPGDQTTDTSSSETIPPLTGGGISSTGTVAGTGETSTSPASGAGMLPPAVPPPFIASASSTPNINVFEAFLPSLFSWLLIVFLSILALTLIIAVIYAIVHEFRKWHAHSTREITETRKKILEDVKRLEKELEAGDTQG